MVKERDADAVVHQVGGGALAAARAAGSVHGAAQAARTHHTT